MAVVALGATEPPGDRVSPFSERISGSRAKKALNEASDGVKLLGVGFELTEVDEGGGLPMNSAELVEAYSAS